MTRRMCQEVEALIDREARGFTEAEALVLEQHLPTCASCREQLETMRRVRDVILSAPVELSDATRGRALARAFARTDEIEIRRTRVLPRRVAWGLGAAAAAALVVFGVTRTPDAAPIAHAPSTPAAATSVDKPAEPLAPQVADGLIEARVPEQRTFAHAIVDLAAGTRVRFDASSTTLALEAGRVEVDVDVTKGRPFRVSTRHFRVEVLGTHFVVSDDTVSVQHGRVQVYDLHGDVLAKELGPGASFSYGEQREAHAEPSTASKPASLPARVWLARAREALAQGDTKTARELVSRAEDSDPHRSDRAEAGTLRAEAALLDHDAKAAVRLYASVAERFGDLVAGENAAFAAAQLAARAEGPERSKKLYERYLARYPKGRFADEAKKRLGR